MRDTDGSFKENDVQAGAGHRLKRDIIPTPDWIYSEDSSATSMKVRQARNERDFTRLLRRS